MTEMARTTKQAKAALSADDPATFDKILKAYADEAKAGVAMFAGGSARHQDIRARFSALESAADTARQQAVTPTRFRAAFSSIVNECRSCHSVYK